MIIWACAAAAGLSPVRNLLSHTQVPSVSTEVTQRAPYELIVHLVVDGHRLSIDRSGACEYAVHRYHNAPTRIESIGQWSDGLPGAIALILPDQEGVVVELPSLCPGVWAHSGELKRQVRATSPLIPSSTLAHYTPAAIWIRDVRHIDSFELYPSIETGPHARMHVRVRNIEVSSLATDSHPMTSTPQEIALAERFGWTQLADVHTTYVAHAAYVLPVSDWRQDVIIRKYISKHRGILILPARASPEVMKVRRAIVSHINNIHARVGYAKGAVFGVPPLNGHYGPADTEYYEIPMIRNGRAWELDPRRRGIRLYYDYSEIKRATGERFYQTIVKCPDCGPDEPLTYKGIKLYPIMNGRRRKLYLESHAAVKSITDGSLFDPDASVLITVGYFEISR